LKICVIGTGYVGLVTGACFADLGHSVVCVDTDKKKVEMMRKGNSPIFEPGLEEVLRRNMSAGRLSFTTDIGKPVRQSNFVFIAVGTPPKDDGQPDMSQVETAAKSIAKNLNGYKIIVNKSTVPVGSGDMVASIIRKIRGAKAKFSVVSNPEFLREGSAIHDSMNPDRIVIGSRDPSASEMVRQLYRSLNANVLITDVRSAELIKYSSNAFLATKISFINEVSRLCERVGADVAEVAKGMGLDRRIGPAFLQAGAGFGGSCFPKDTWGLLHTGNNAEMDMLLLKSVIQVNEDQKKFMVSKVRSAAGSLKGKKIAVWGLAFKGNTDDMREAISIDVIRALVDAGAKVTAYDPAAMENAKRSLPDIGYAKDQYEAARGADFLLVLTEWNEFKDADMKKVKGLLKTPLIVDGRNLYDLKTMKKLGFTYRGVGRSA
jgi:UDPglucose 6-dehydrogenase